jgi:hypothetical protein
MYIFFCLYSLPFTTLKRLMLRHIAQGSSMLSLNANRSKARFWTGIKMLTSVINLNTIELKSK